MAAEGRRRALVADEEDATTVVGDGGEVVAAGRVAPLHQVVAVDDRARQAARVRRGDRAGDVDQQHGRRHPAGQRGRRDRSQSGRHGGGEEVDAAGGDHPTLVPAGGSDAWAQGGASKRAVSAYRVYPHERGAAAAETHLPDRGRVYTEVGRTSGGARVEAAERAREEAWERARGERCHLYRTAEERGVAELAVEEAAEAAVVAMVVQAGPIWYERPGMSSFEPTTIVPDGVDDEVFVHVIGATVWTDERPADGSWRTHVVGVLGGAVWHAVDVPAGEDPSDGAAVDLYGYHGRAGEDAWLAAGRAVQLVEWGRTHQYCGRCGTPTEPAPGERAMRCPACGLSASRAWRRR